MQRNIHFDKDNNVYGGMLSLSIIGALVTTTFISALILSSSPSTATSTSTTANASVTVGSACTVSGTGMNSHTDTIPNGTYDNTIGETTIKITCNDANGFSVYAIGFTGEQYEGADHTKLIGSNSGEKIVTGTATSAGAQDVSNWAMKVSAVSGTYAPTILNGYSSFNVVPDTYTKVATRTSGTDAGEGATGSSIKTTYAAYISKTQAADTYNGKVKYTMVHPNTETPLQPQTSAANKICYYANASSAVGTMGCQTIPTSGTSYDVSPTSAILLASNFSRAGYGFAGWSDAFDYATNPNANFYGPQEYIEFTEGQYSGTNEGLSLYAVWAKSEGSLQDASKVSSVCGNLTTAPTDGTANLRSVSALTDQRDNETYAIAKLADGNCWMIENLRLESTNSDNSSGALAQGYGTSSAYGNFSGLATAESANFSNSTTANSLYYSGTQSGTASVDIGTINSPGYRIPRYNNYNHQTTSANRPQNPTINDATNSTTKASMYSYGNYYNWAAAIADTSYYAAEDQSVTNTSLCPKGWRPPRGGSKIRIVSGDINDFWNLTVNYLNGGTLPANYNSSNYPYYNGTTEATPVADKLRSYPNNLLYSGRFESSSVYSRGSSGYYLPSSAGNDFLLINSSRVYPGTNSTYKYLGYSIRCIAGS